MFFKNISVFALTKDATVDIEKFDEMLSEGEFTKCGSSQSLSRGWTTPLGKHGKMFTHVSGHNIMICQKTEEKVISASAINLKIQERVEAIEKNESRKVTRKEKSEIKQDIIFEITPNILPKQTLLYGYINIKKNYIVINTAAAKRAEEFISHLRETIGSCPVIAMSTKSIPMQSMTAWLTNKDFPEKFSVQGECELKDLQESGSRITCKHQDLCSDEIHSMLQNGMTVSSIAMTWADKIDFVVNEKLQIKKIKYSDLIQEQAENENAEDAATQFDVDFVIMTAELEEFILYLADAFGGAEIPDTAIEQFEMTGFGGGSQ